MKKLCPGFVTFNRNSTQIVLKSSHWRYNSSYSSEEDRAFFAETWLQLQQKECPHMHGGQHLEEAFQSCRTLLLKCLHRSALVLQLLLLLMTKEIIFDNILKLHVNTNNVHCKFDLIGLTVFLCCFAFVFVKPFRRIKLLKVNLMLSMAISDVQLPVPLTGCDRSSTDCTPNCRQYPRCHPLGRNQVWVQLSNRICSSCEMTAKIHLSSSLCQMAMILMMWNELLQFFLRHLPN